MRTAALAILILSQSLPSFAQDMALHHDHHMMEAAQTPDDAPLKITVNPEARVSVVLAGPMPAPKPCGTAVEMPVKIINQGFVTARLEAELVGDLPPGTTLDFHPEPLTGIAEERRTLRISLAKPETVDLTIAFRAHNEAPDLGGRDRVHFLMRCE